MKFKKIAKFMVFMIIKKTGAIHSWREIHFLNTRGKLQAHQHAV